MTATAPNEMRTMITALVGIRGIASTWVVLEHFRFVLYDLFPATGPLDWWLAGANVAMEIFFPLSGFIISYMYADRLQAKGSYGDYLLKRFARVYPVFIVTTLVVAALVAAAAIAHVTLNSMGTRFTPISFACNLVLLQGALPGCPAWNPPAWSISVEMLAYIAFPLTAWLLVRLTTPRTATIAAIAWLLAGTSAMMAYRLVNNEWASPGMALLRITTEFVAGAMLWKAWSLAGQPRALKWDVIAVGIVVFTVVALAFLPREQSFGLILTPMLAFLVVACASASGPVKWVLSTRVVMFGGQISYSLYMVHFIVLIFVGKMLPWEHFENASLLIRVALISFYFLTCFAIAVACYLFLEEPARRAIHRAADRRAMRRVSQS